MADGTGHNAPTLADYARRMRNLVEQDVATAADLRELNKEMRERGLQGGVLKALIKAQVLDEQDEGGAGKRLERALDRVDNAAAYADMLGLRPEKVNNDLVVVNDLGNPAEEDPLKIPDFLRRESNE